MGNAVFVNELRMIADGLRWSLRSLAGSGDRLLELIELVQELHDRVIEPNDTFLLH